MVWAERRELSLFSRLYKFNIKLLLTSSMPFQKRKSGKISRAQKYRIKWKAPWIFSKKLLKHIQNKAILAKIIRIPMRIKDICDEMSKYTITRIVGKSDMPNQINILKKDVIQREFLSFWKKIQLINRYKRLFIKIKTDTPNVSPPKNHSCGNWVYMEGILYEK